MGHPEEPEYQVFDYVCDKCGAKFTQASSVKLRPSFRDCPFCRKIVETLTVELSEGRNRNDERMVT